MSNLQEQIAAALAAKMSNRTESNATTHTGRAPRADGTYTRNGIRYNNRLQIGNTKHRRANAPARTLPRSRVKTLQPAERKNNYPHLQLFVEFLYLYL